MSIEGCFDRDSLVERADQFRCQLEAVPVPPPPAWPGGAPLEQGPQSGAMLCRTRGLHGRPARPIRPIGRGWPELGSPGERSGADRSLRRLILFAFGTGATASLILLHGFGDSGNGMISSMGGPLVAMPGLTLALTLTLTLPQLHTLPSDH